MLVFGDADFRLELSFDRVFDLVKRGMVDYGVLPVENSSTGSVNDAYLPLLNQDYVSLSVDVKVSIVDEIVLPIHHHLLVRDVVELADIEVVYSQEQPFKQCSEFMDQYLAHATQEVTSSTAEAARRASENPASACLAGDLLRQEWNLTALHSDVQDLSTNLTRFVVISAKHTAQVTTGPYKTTVAAVLLDQPGALVGMLNLFADEKINILNIKTLPVRDTRFLAGFKDWFVLDVRARDTSPEFTAYATKRSERLDLFMAYKVLGSYPMFDMFGGPSPRAPGTGPGTGPSTLADNLETLIQEGESGTVEFKATMRVDMKDGTVNRALPPVVGKTIAAFLNTDGGTLFIGVDDDGNTVGIEADIRSVSRKDVDGYLSALFQVVVNLVGAEFCQFVKPVVLQRDGKDICVVTVNPASTAAWLKEGNDEKLYVRAGNASRALQGRQASNYITEHFSRR